MDKKYYCSKQDCKGELKEMYWQEGYDIYKCKICESLYDIKADSKV